jgi:acetyl-CoA carboxylase biotin carboxyl carrier protein
MADEANQSFDLDRLRQLVKLMEKYDLREVKLKGGGQEWVLRRGGDPVPVVSAPMGVPAAPAAPAAAAGPAPETPPAADDGLVDVKSPMVGTFYRSPSPDEPPFVKEGDRVTPDTVVCLVEAMKFFNQIKAEASGTIVKICVSDGDPVEFGQPLFKVKAG